MRVLLDENLPHRLRSKLTGCEAVTAADAGLSGLKNSALLRAAINAGFDVLVTADKTLQYEQNLSRHAIGIVLLSTNLWQLIQSNAGKIELAIEEAAAENLVDVDCGTFSRRLLRPPALGPT